MSSGKKAPTMISPLQFQRYGFTIEILAACPARFGGHMNIIKQPLDWLRAYPEATAVVFGTLAT
jgi:hypothetical protein